jgi:hypothetical protein
VLHQAPACDGLGGCQEGQQIPCASGICLDAQSCYEVGPGSGVLHISQGEPIAPDTRVQNGSPRTVLNLVLTAEEVPGMLNSMRVEFPGLEQAPSRWRQVRVDLYGDDQLLSSVFLAESAAHFENIGFRFAPGPAYNLRLEMSVLAPVPAMAAWPLLALLLLSPVFVRRSRRRLLLLLLLVMLAACQRYGYYPSILEGRARLNPDPDVQAQPAYAEDMLETDDTPVEGDSFVLDLSR